MLTATRTITVPPLDLRAAIGAIDDAARTVELTFSTGADVIRYDWETGRRYIERLSLEPKAVRLGRLNSGAPLLNAHSAYSLSNQIGVVQDGTARIADKVGTATVRFSKRADVEPFYQDVKDKVIRNVSVGYATYRAEDIGLDKATGMMIRLSTDWEPYEISMVPMGADSGAQTRSSKDVLTFPCALISRAAEEIADADRLRRFRLLAATL